MASTSHLSGPLLVVLSIILCLMEALGELPQHIALLLLVLIPKKTGGRRPIGIEPSP